MCEIDLSRPGITLLSGENQKDGGSNGSGKSSAIVETIVYSLFGQTTKNLKAEQVVNNKTKKDCYVEISLNINQDNYIVRRYRQHSQFGNKLSFEKNAVDISKEKVKDTQALIESIIQIGFKSFVLSIVLSQERIANFAETEPTERKKIIESLLMFDFISKYHKGVREILKKINSKVEGFELSLTEKKKTVDAITKNLMSYVDKWGETEKAKKDRIKELKKALESWSHIDVAKELSVRTQIAEKKRDKENFVSKKESSEETVFQAKGNIQKLSIKIADKEKDIKKINDNPEICSICGSKKESWTNSGKLDDYLQKLTTEKNSLDLAQKELESTIDRESELAKEFIKKIEAKTLEISTLQSSIDSLSDDEIANIQQKITASETEIKLLESQTEKKIEEDEYIIGTQKKIEGLREEIKELKSQTKTLNDDKIYYDWWKEALSNSNSSIKSFCVNHILKSFNKYINYYLEFFGMDISYSLDVELQDTIKKDGELITFTQLSGGEKRSVELSLIFALYEIVRLKLPDNINIIVLDELMSHFLDDVRITGALEILSELESRKLSIFVIDHKSLVKENLDCQIIKVVKDKEGFSNLEIP
jgi:DNA repair exonuclease SbcCD ATPase subunit